MDILEEITRDPSPEDGLFASNKLPRSPRRGPVFLKLLSKYTLKEVAVPAVLALLIVGFLAVIVELREKSENIPIEYVRVVDIARLLFYFLPSLVAFVIPITYMMGILLAFGSLAQNNEITAMKAAGIPLKRVLLPVLVAGALLSAVTFLLQDQVQPLALQRAIDLMYRELPMRGTVDILPAGRMHEFGPWRVYFRERDPKTGTLHGIDLLKENEDGSVWAYWAESARVEKDGAQSIIHINNGRLIMPQEDGTAVQTGLQDTRIALPSVTAERARDVRDALGLSALLEDEKEMTAAIKASPSHTLRNDLRDVRWQIADRIAMPLICLSVSLLAAPLAVRGARGGKSYSFAIGFILVLAYQSMRILLEPSSLHPLSEVIARAMVPNLLIGGLGIIAVWRVDRI